MSGMRKRAHGKVAAGGSQESEILVPEGMTAFDFIYDQPDPRAYFRALGPLEYQSLLRAAQDACLITITGGATFLSPRTFQPILSCAQDPVWVAAFVLRTTSYEPIAACLASYGLVTETTTTHTFRQRRFTDAEESAQPSVFEQDSQEQRVSRSRSSPVMRS
ncbi:hypothetical protein [Streptomyces sp. NPDC097981]|uniref:hypothetical protein n=1 Tax=Streptomyces sp. NPDC097981 TaxID=3155428 RepID=UPI003326DA1E